MMSQFGTIYCFLLLLGQLIFIGVIDAQQYEFTTTIQDENGANMEFRWVKTRQVLANEHLPIFNVKLGQPITRNANIMERIGQFVTYHDVDRSSAVILIQKSDCLFGVIGTKYLIIGLPIEHLNEKHIIGISRYVVLAPLSGESTPSTDVVPSSAKDFSTLPLKKRPVVDANPTISHSSDIKRERADEKVVPQPNMDPSGQGSILKKYLSYGELPTRSQPDGFIKKILSESSHSSAWRDNSQNVDKQPMKTPADTSASNKLLKILLQSPCKAMSVEEKKHLGNFFPEILIFVSYDTVKSFNKIQCVDENFEPHVIYFIMFMNAVAMLFGKLMKDVNVHINIAGIIFENEEGAFPFSNPKFVNNQLVTRNGELVLKSIKNYINLNINDGSKRHSIFTEDAFDFFMFLTTFGYESQETDEEFNEELRKYGVSTELYDVMEQRTRLRYFGKNLNVLGAAVDDSNALKSYVDAAREIAHLMAVNEDYFESGSIMGKTNRALNRRCSDCLKWSSESMQSFKNYFRWNKNRCFLINEPRSLHPYDVPRRTLFPSTQCHCYTFGVKYEESLTLNPQRSDRSCTAPLPCVSIPEPGSSTNRNLIQHILRLSKTVPPPVDGTPCDEDKVCWQRQCVLERTEVVILE